MSETSFTAAGVRPAPPNSSHAIPDGPARVVLPSLFARLLEDAKREVAKPTVVVPIEKVRPGYSLIFSSDLPKAQLEVWQERCRKSPGSNDLNSLLLSEIIISHQCIGIRLEGDMVKDAQGDPVTFNDPQFQIVLTGIDSNANEAVRKFIGKDGWVEAVASAVLQACGYDATVQADPLVS